MGGEEKCGKERVKSQGNSSCCPSTLLLQVSDEFLLFGFPHAHSSAIVSKPSNVSFRRIILHSCMDRGDWRVKKEKKTTTLKCVYLFEDGLTVFKSHVGKKKEVRERKTERKGHSVGSDQRGYFVQGNCSVLLL